MTVDSIQATRRGCSIRPSGRAAVILLGYGALWFSVRDQHPYTGPSGATIAAVYAAVIVVVAVSAKVLRRATAGVRGPSRRQTRAEGVAIVTAYLATAVFQGALQHDGASHAIVRGYSRQRPR
jgi:hypothetical protein